MNYKQKGSATIIKLSRLAAAVSLLGCVVVAHAQTNTASATNQTTNSLGQARPKLATPPSRWKSSIAFGLTVSRGNADTILESASASTEKKWLQNDLLFGADGLYGEAKTPNTSTSTETAETLHGFSQYNRSFWGTAWDGFYGFGRIDGFHDGIADIKYRLTLAPGLGYYFVTNKTADFSAEIGPGYVKEQLGDETESFATLRLGEAFHYRISPHAKAWEAVKVLPQVNQFDNYVVVAEVGLEAGLTRNNRLNLRSVLQDNYNNIPAADRLKNDLKLITSFVYKF